MGTVAAMVGGVLGVIGLGVGAYGYQEYVVRNPGEHLSRKSIYGVIVQESPVFYRDGTTRVGVFFEDEHREFVAWDDLPPTYVMGLVATEDAAFWEHPGINPKGIARAMVANAMAGHLVAGGSTLTQQTAKNLYYRPDRSIGSKLTELVDALRLEAHYDKTEILTFYANQFHVSGNGRGLGIAARYFFDKRVEQLTFVEGAFLAGLVKAPSYYDPFIGDANRRALSAKRAHDRTEHVLRRIIAVPVTDLAGPKPGQGKTTREQYVARGAIATKAQVDAKKLLEDGFELQFKRGTFRYDSSAVLDEVARRLQEAPFDEVLKKAGIADPATAGIQVITTLDPAVQREAIYGLWHHLSDIGTQLEGLGAKDFIHADSRGPLYDPDRQLIPHEFSLAKVVKHLDDGGKVSLDVDLGGVVCAVDREAVTSAALAVERGRTHNKSEKVSTTTANTFANALTDGSIVWVSVRAVTPKGATCDLEVRPELQGALMVTEDGAVRAMVGGNDNRNFNRATALRQMGSTWKPLIYHAALQLGWDSTDLLDNRRNVFPYSTTFYYPRPDHDPHDEVSMAWAGVNSENLASIWLLYHLLDRLNGEQVRALADRYGLSRQPDESEPAYRLRIQKEGILPTPGRVDEGLFLQARQEVLSGLALDGHPEDALALSSLLYGWGFDAERARVNREGGSARGWKLRALDHNYLDLVDRLDSCEAQHRALVINLRSGRLPARAVIPDLSVLMTADRVQVACGTPPEGFAAPDQDLLDDLVPAEMQAGAHVQPGIRGALGAMFGGPAPRLPIDVPADMIVGERLHDSTLRGVESSLRRRKLVRQRVDADAPGLYDSEVLFWHQDFRVLLAMKYVKQLAQSYGVQTPINEVLSMPLGASEITLEEAVSVYEGVTTGQAWTYPGKVWSSSSLMGEQVGSTAAPTLLIAELRDVNGRVIYRADPLAAEVVGERVGQQTADILRNVVQYGTGRRASGAIREQGVPIPLGGKTGTTNDFRNAAFLGFVPKASGDGYSVDGGFVVGAYVGYDDNRPMDVGNLRIAGASGALPAWIVAAQALHDQGLLGAPKGAPSGGRWSLRAPGSLRVVAVDATVGKPLEPQPDVIGPEQATVLAFRELRVRPEVSIAAARPSRPSRIAPRTIDVMQLIEERRKKRKERADGKTSVWEAP